MYVDDDRLAVGVVLLGVYQRLLHLGRVGDGDADSAERLGDAGVVARHLGDAELRPRGRVAAGIGCHAAVVQHDGRYRSARPLRRLGVEAGHPERAVAHEVEAELVGAGQLGADHQGDAEAEVGGLSPADVAVRRGRVVERNDRVAGRARVVGDDRPGLVQRGVDLVDDAVGVDRHLVGLEQRRPLLHPLLPLSGDPVAHAGVPGRLADGRLDLVDDHCERLLGVARQAHVYALLLVDVVYVVGVLDERLARRDRLTVAGVGEAGADGEQHVGFQQPLARGPGGRAGACAERQRVRLRERALALHGGVHGHVEQLGELHQLVGGVSEQHASAGPKHGVAGLQEQLDGVLDVRPRWSRHRAAG